jgi:dephospho-CoA kinase
VEFICVLYQIKLIYLEGDILINMNEGQVMLGITGTNGAGKGTIVEFLVNEKGFKHFSASGLITEEIVRRDMPVNRDSMIVVANDLRAKYGPGYIAEELLRRAGESEENRIIESIRTLGEVEKLKANGGVLLAVDAEQRTRYERNIKRGSNKDQVSFEEFAEQERKEMESEDPNKQNLSACIKMADYVVQNNGTIEELNKEIEKILIIIKNK